MSTASDAMMLPGMAHLRSALLALATTVVGICAVTFLLSYARYQLAMSRARSAASTDLRPPVIPYWIPWLGSSLSFLTPSPGKFYRDVLTRHPPEMGFFGTVLAGEVNHIVYSTRAVQALFKVKPTVAHREHLTKDIFIKSLDVSTTDFDKMLADGQLAHMQKDEEMNQELLLRQQAVNENTGTYVEFFRQQVASWSRDLDTIGADRGNKGEVVVNLYSWLQKQMFRPSCKAFLGGRMNDLYPELEADFWRFDRSMLDLLFGIPKFIKPGPYEVRDRLVENITRWVEEGDIALARQYNNNDKTSGQVLPDPYYPEAEWEPIWGSRLSRSRQARWTSEGLTPRGRASMELGFLFGLNSNVIPATGWMLMHILHPKNPDLLPRVLTELRRAVIPPLANQERTTVDISNIDLDINVLTVQPLLLSLYQEVLRRYVDVLVARKAEQDFRLPLDSTTPQGKPHMLLVRKGETIITPNIVSQNDPAFFMDPPADVFDPERFLVPAVEAKVSKDASGKIYTDEYAFSTAAVAHKFWPYGGGKTICPGRVFAKQEILASVAILLLGFDFTVEDPTGYEVPGFANVYGGSGTIPPGGDVKVRLRPRAV